MKEEHLIPKKKKKITLLSEFKFIDTVEQILLAYLAENICYLYVEWMSFGILKSESLKCCL